MSHSVQVTLIADQYVQLLGKEVNVHDLDTITLDNDGVVASFQEKGCCGITKEDQEYLVGLAEMFETKDRVDFERGQRIHIGNAIAMMIAERLRAIVMQMEVGGSRLLQRVTDSAGDKR